MPRTCFVPGCKNGTRKDRREIQLSGKRKACLFKAPKNNVLRQEWSRAISADKELSANSYVCEDHFDENDIERAWQAQISGETVNLMKKETTRLKPKAIPIFSKAIPANNESSANKHVSEDHFDENDIDGTISIKEEETTCLNPNTIPVFSSSPAADKELSANNVSGDHFDENDLDGTITIMGKETLRLKPNTISILKKQTTHLEASAIPAFLSSTPADKGLSANSKVSEDNFDENDIDGTTSIMVKGTTYLKPNTISILKATLLKPNTIPAFSSSMSVDKKLSANNYSSEYHFDENDIDGTISIMEEETTHLKPNALIPVPSSSSFSQINYQASCSKRLKLENLSDSHDETGFTFLKLSENLTSLQKPNKMWGISHHEEFIICARWTENFIAQKLVVLGVDLKYRVFICNNELTEMDKEEINCIDDVAKILGRVERYVICRNILNGYREPYCGILVLDNHLGARGRPRTVCEPCFDNSQKSNVSKSQKHKISIKSFITSQYS